MNLIKPFLCVLSIIVGVCVVCPSSNLLLAADLSQGPSLSEVVVGIDGHYRSGRWTAIRVPGESLDGATIETLDGDGCPVVYRQPKTLSSGGTLYAVPGSEAVPLVITDRDGVEVVSTRFPEFLSPEKGASMVPVGMSWVIVIGDPMGIEKIGANELLDRDAQIAVSRPQSAESFPDSVVGYDGVDLVVITGAGADVVGAFSESQSNALAQWVRGGGRMLMTLGKTGVGMLRQSAPLRELLPFDSSKIKSVSIDPAGLESFTSSQTRLNPFVGIQLPSAIGEQGATAIGQRLVTGRTTRRVSIPIATDFNAGFGRLSVVAADLDQGQFVDWPERMDLLVRLAGPVLKLDRGGRESANRSTAYDDIAGQTRVILDRFELKRGMSFSGISLIILGLIAVIGPLDYLLVNRVFGRPLLGWMTFPIVAILVSVFLIVQVQPQASDDSVPGDSAGANSAPVDSQCNRLEIVDIDAVSGTGRGFSWDFVYSDPARRVDAEAGLGNSLASISTEVTTLLTAPYSYPGATFGGIQISGEDARFPGYTVQMDSSGATISAQIAGLPVAPMSSKSIATQYTFSSVIGQDTSVKRREGSSNSISGAFVNPLPVDLYDAMLVFRNTVYFLPKRFPAGAKVGEISRLRQKVLSWKLSGQQSVESSARKTWDPTGTQTLQRVSDLLMFYDAAGGNRFAKLNHAPLSFLDLSSVLSSERCMLVGRSGKPVSGLDLMGSEAIGGESTMKRSQIAGDGQHHTMIRLIVPVKETARYM